MLITGLIGALLLSGTAHAVPVPTGRAALTKNPIFTAGKLPVSSCPENSLEIEDFLTAENYLRVGAECLDKTWTKFFKKAKLPFRTPGMEFIHKPSMTRGCGQFPTAAWGGIYCDDRQSLVVLVDGWMLEYSGSVFLFYVLAHEYGHHIQQRAGVLKAADKLAPKGFGKKAYEWNRRVELQADCLAGAFMKSVWSSLDRDSYDWSELLKLIKEDMGDPTHGKGSSRAYWTNRGFKSGAPSACQTFSAASKYVA